MDLRERGLDVTRPMLVGIDGSKALRKAVLDVLDHPVIQRCQLHKIRNVKDHLPQRLRSSVGRKMTDAYHAASALEAEAALLALAKELDRTHPGAAAQPARGPRRDPYGAAPRRAAHAGPYAALNQRHRVDDLGVPRTLPPTSSAGATDRWRCAGAPPAWSRPASSSAVSTATCTYRHFVSHSNGQSPKTVTPVMHNDQVSAA